MTMAPGPLDAVTVPELKDQCRAFGLKVSGSRLELVDRLRKKQRQQVRSLQPEKKRALNAPPFAGRLKRRLVGKQAVTAADWLEAPLGWLPSAAAVLAETLVEGVEQQVAHEETRATETEAPELKERVSSPAAAAPEARDSVADVAVSAAAAAAHSASAASEVMHDGVAACPFTACAAPAAASSAASSGADGPSTSSALAAALVDQSLAAEQVADGPKQPEAAEESKAVEPESMQRGLKERHADPEPEKAAVATEPVVVKQEEQDPDFAPESSEEEEVIELRQRVATPAPVFASPSPGLLSPSPLLPAAPPPSPAQPSSVPAPPSSWWTQSPSNASFLTSTYSRLLKKEANARQDKAVPSPPRWEPGVRGFTPKRDVHSGCSGDAIAAPPPSALSPAPRRSLVAASPTPARSPALLCSPPTTVRQSVEDSKQQMLKQLTAQMQLVIKKLSAPGVAEESREKYQELANSIKKQMDKLSGIGRHLCSPSPAKAMLPSASPSAVFMRQGGC